MILPVGIHPITGPSIGIYSITAGRVHKRTAVPGWPAHMTYMLFIMRMLTPVDRFGDDVSDGVHINLIYEYAFITKPKYARCGRTTNDVACM